MPLGMHTMKMNCKTLSRVSFVLALLSPLCFAQVTNESVMSELVEQGVISEENVEELKQSLQGQETNQEDDPVASEQSAEEATPVNQEDELPSTDETSENAEGDFAAKEPSKEPSKDSTKDSLEPRPLNVVEEEKIVTPQIKTTDLLNLLISEGVISRESAVRLVTVLRKRAEKMAQNEETLEPHEDDSVRVPYLPKYVEDRIAEKVKAGLAESVTQDAREKGLVAPAWTENLKLSGDVRFRYSGEFYPNDNPDQIIYDYESINDSGSVENAERDAFYKTTDERQRYLGRARLYLKSKLSDHYTMGMRLTSGSGGSPVSANQTLGRFGSKWEAYFDLAFIQYQSKHFRLLGGRFENPWVSSDLVWDRDMTFEGVFLEATPIIFGGEKPYFSSFINIGAFPIQELHSTTYPSDRFSSPGDKWLYTAEIGADFDFGTDTNVSLGLGYYAYKNITGKTNARGQNSQDPTASSFYQFGNSVQNIAVPEFSQSGEVEELYALAAEYEMINLTLKIDYLGLNEHKLSFLIDAVENSAFDREEVNARVKSNAIAEVSDEFDVGNSDFGYQLATSFGTKAQYSKGSWNGRLAYRYIEGDATLDAFADSDFLVGGTNAQGYILSGNYFVADNVWFGLKIISADEVGDFPILRDRTPNDDSDEETRDLREDTIFIDINARF